jgi:hypothetical protein
MILKKILFQGVAVGLQITAENEDEKELLRCLSGLKTAQSKKFNRDPLPALILCPLLPGDALYTKE